MDNKSFNEAILRPMLYGDDVPVEYAEGGCNIAAVAGNMWMSSGPVDAVFMLCRVCLKNEDVALGDDEDFQERALFLASSLARACTRTCAMPCAQDETV